MNSANEGYDLIRVKFSSKHDNVYWDISYALKSLKNRKFSWKVTLVEVTK